MSSPDQTAERADRRTRPNALIVVPSPALALVRLRQRPRLADAVAAAGAMLLSVVLLFPLYGLASASLSVPFTYRADSLFEEMVVKSLVDHGSYLHNPSLGAPFGQQLYDFPLGSANLNYLLIRFLALFTHDAAVVMNLFYLLTFPLIALTAFLVLRALGVTRLVAAAVALLYAYAPFHFGRGELQLQIAAYYAVPLAAYLVLAVLMRLPLFARRTTDGPRVLAYLSRRTIGTIVVCAVVASTGGYYALFTVVLLVVAALAAAVGYRSVLPLAAGAASVAAILVFTVLNLAPTVAYHLRHGANPVVPSRTASETDALSLHVADMVVPVAANRIPPLSDLANRYADQVAGPYVSEHGLGVSLGTVATIGYLALLLALLAAALRSSGIPRVVAAAGLVAGAATVFASTGGFETLLSYYTTPLLRAGNRLSIFIAFFALLPVALFLDWLRARFEARRFPPLAFAAVVAAILGFGLVDQASPGFQPPYVANAIQYHNDARFVRAIERKLPPGSAIFQVPHVPFPEMPLGSVGPYDPVRGYLHSDTLRWSFGAMHGRPDDWADVTATDLPPKVFLASIVASGFDGLWVDRFGYGDRGRAFEAALAGIVGHGPAAVSRDGRFSFFDIRTFAAHLRRKTTPALLAQLREATLHPIRAESGAGMLREEANGLSTNDAVQGYRRFAWRWTSKPSADLVLVNPSSSPRTADLQLFFQAGTGGGRLSIAYPDGTSQPLAIDTSGRSVKGTITLRPGDNPIRLSYSGHPLVDASQQPLRTVYVRVMARITDRVFDAYGGVPPLVGCILPFPTNNCVASE